VAVDPREDGGGEAYPERDVVRRQVFEDGAKQDAASLCVPLVTRLHRHQPLHQLWIAGPPQHLLPGLLCTDGHTQLDAVAWREGGNPFLQAKSLSWSA